MSKEKIKPLLFADAINATSKIKPQRINDKTLSVT